MAKIENIMDPLTKGLPRDQVQYTTRRMGLGQKPNRTDWRSQDLCSIRKLVGEVHVCKHTFNVNGFILVY